MWATCITWKKNCEEYVDWGKVLQNHSQASDSKICDFSVMYNDPHKKRQLAGQGMLRYSSHFVCLFSILFLHLLYEILKNYQEKEHKHGSLTSTWHALKKQPPTHKREYLLQQFNESQYIE